MWNVFVFLSTDKTKQMWNLLKT